MYNEELKLRFIKDYTKSVENQKQCRSTFNAAEKYELMWDADICTRSVEDVTPMLEEIAGIRKNTSASRVVILRKYAQWCIEQGVKGSCDSLLRVEVVGLESIRHKMVANPKMLEKRLSATFDNYAASESDIKNSIDNIYKGFYWMAFAGIPEEDILQITSDEVHFDEMLIRHKDINYPIYTEALPVIRSCVEADSFLYFHSNYKSSLRPRLQGSKVILRSFDSVYSVPTMRSALSRITRRRVIDNAKDESQAFKLSYVRVKLSGMFYRKYQDEIAGDEIDFRVEAKEFVQGKAYKEGFRTNTTEAKQRRAELDYMRDYQRWKLAFRLV